MTTTRFRRFAAVLALAFVLVAGACAGERAQSASVPATTAAAPAGPSPAAAPASPPTAVAANPAPGAISVPGATCVAFPDGPESTRSLDANRTLCTFRDAQGREVTLTAGRSSRGKERGEFGWAHLRDKHFYGLWEAGGANTRYSVVGARTEADVIELLAKSLQDSRPSTSADGRREYRATVAGTGHAVLVVVGDNGRIITAYPVPEARR